jgi:cellulose synthase/poly-beta-1,6-N-acetylglucosamine synthase-like glycosyltransferase
MIGLDSVGFLLLMLTLLAALPVCVVTLQLAAALFRHTEDVGDVAAVRSSRGALVVLMPAHNEAVGIADAIAAVRAQLCANDRLLIVADNCTDATASIARAAGAEVCERIDSVRRGKGYALDHGVRWLEQDQRDPPAFVAIVDADCIVEPHALERLAQRCMSSGGPVQALYLMQAPQGASLSLRVAEFAWLIKNELRPTGSAALGGPCQLMGTGMVFPWAVIRKAPLASGHLVEDMQLGLDLARGGGTPPVFCPQARVISKFPSDVAGAIAQRTRWEHGHLSVIASVGPRLLARALMRGDLKLAAMVLDLMVPPLAALLLGLSVLLAVDFAWWWRSGDQHPVAVAGLALFQLVGVVLASWWRFGRHLVSWRELLSLPLYVAGKIPIYVRVFTRRQVEWVRTKRDDRGR